MKNYIAHAITCMLILLLNTPLAFGQSGEKKFLNIGDKVPDFEFAIKNYKTPTAKLSDFRGKLVILDFWAIFCGACIHAMPHMQELQKKFGDKIQIIMVTKDTEEKIASISARAENVRDNKLPSAVNAQQLAGLFDYLVLPTHAWIDQNGVLKYIATGSDATAENIAAFLEGKDIGLKEKKDLNLNYDIPLLVNWYPYQKDFTFYTYLAPFNKDYYAGGSHGIRRMEDGTISRVIESGSTLMQIYQMAYGIDGYKFAKNRILMNFSGAEKYIEDAKIRDLFKQKYVYQYELINNRPIKDEQIFNFMQRQLDMAFNLKSSWQKLKRECNVLRQLPGVDLKLKSKNVPTKDFEEGTHYTIQNVKWRNFVSKQSSNVERQFIDETGIDPQLAVTLTIDESWENLDLVNKSLKPYGLYVTMEERMFECIVLENP